MIYSELSFPASSRFLVTGGAGFIGSNLCEAILKTGYRVRYTCMKVCEGVGYVPDEAACDSAPRSNEMPLFCCAIKEQRITTRI